MFNTQVFVSTEPYELQASKSQTIDRLKRWLKEPNIVILEAADVDADIMEKLKRKAVAGDVHFIHIAADPSACPVLPEDK